MLVISLAVVQWVRDPWEFTARVYHRRLPQEFTTGGYCGEFTMGVYCRRLLWEVNTGVYCGRLPSEFTLGDYHGSLPLGLKVYHYLSLVTSDYSYQPLIEWVIIGNLKFEAYLRCYTDYGWLIVSEL